jgi:adsorption protein B
VTQGDGIAFDTQSLTEDYDIGFRLKQIGMMEIFVRFPVLDQEQLTDLSVQRRPGRSVREASVISVREYFPDTLAAAVRQKSRWITGIVIQGFRTLQWSKNAALNYFLWRDRKGVITNFVSFLATLVALQVIALWLYQKWVPDSYKFLSIFEGDWWLAALLLANLVLMLNRMVQRVFFVTSYYGITQGIMSLPRIFWGNLVNFLANWRAVTQALRAKDIRRMAWAKTDHQFPVLGEAPRQRRPLGHILMEQGSITEEHLNAAIEQMPHGLRLGSALVHLDFISGEQLAKAIAEQSGVTWESIENLAIDELPANLMPATVALRYGIVPLREEGRTLVLGSESTIDPVSLAAIKRKLGRSIKYVIVPKGQATVALRHLYARHETEPARKMLDTAIQEGRISTAKAYVLWKQYVSKQLLLGDVLQSIGLIDPAAFGSLLLRHEKTQSSLGDFLVNEGLLSQAALVEALQIQQQYQPSMADLLHRATQDTELAIAT